VRWFQEQPAAPNVDFVLRSFQRLLMLTTTTRLQEQVGYSEAQRTPQLQMSGDSSMDVDLFRFEVCELIMPAASLPASSLPVAADAQMGRVYRVRIQRKRSPSLFLAMGAVTGREPDTRAVELSGDVAAAELRLQYWNSDSFFTLSSADDTHVLCTRVDGGAPEVCFVPKERVEQQSHVFERGFYFGELYHGYRSLSLYVASHLQQPAQPHADRIRADPHFAREQVRLHESLLVDFKRQTEADRCCRWDKKGECLRLHTAKQGKRKQPTSACFDEGHCITSCCPLYIIATATRRVQRPATSSIQFSSW
jgi:hypothetical protein